MLDVCCSMFSENDGGKSTLLYFERAKERTKERRQERTKERKNRLAKRGACCGATAKEGEGAGGVNSLHWAHASGLFCCLESGSDRLRRWISLTMLLPVRLLPAKRTVSNLASSASSFEPAGSRRFWWGLSHFRLSSSIGKEVGRHTFEHDCGEGRKG